MKKKDRLEQFIVDHREAFDDERPSFKVWADIEKQLKKQNKPTARQWWIWSVAASFLLIAGMAAGILIYPKFYEYQQLQVLNQSEEFNGTEKYFEREVDALFVQLKGDEQALGLEEELKKIDGQIDKLKVELIRAPKNSREILLQAIIESFETKVNLLETAINRKKEVKNLKNEIQHI